MEEELVLACKIVDAPTILQILRQIKFIDG